MSESSSAIMLIHSWSCRTTLQSKLLRTYCVRLDEYSQCITYLPCCGERTASTVGVTIACFPLKTAAQSSNNIFHQDQSSRVAVVRARVTASTRLGGVVAWAPSSLEARLSSPFASHPFTLLTFFAPPPSHFRITLIVALMPIFY